MGQDSLTPPENLLSPASFVLVVLQICASLVCSDFGLFLSLNYDVVDIFSLFVLCYINNSLNTLSLFFSIVDGIWDYVNIHCSTYVYTCMNLDGGCHM